MGETGWSNLVSTELQGPTANLMSMGTTLAGLLNETEGLTSLQFLTCSTSEHLSFAPQLLPILLSLHL